MSWDKTVFLLSNWYSGATVLTLLLDRHPSIVSNGEAFPFGPEDDRSYICSCGSPLLECSFYRQAGAHLWLHRDFDRELFAREPSFRGPEVLRRMALSPRFSGVTRESLASLIPGYARARRRFVEAHLEFMKRATEIKSATTYLDGTKSIRRAEILLQEVSGPTSLWLLVRDCRGFCCSALRNWGWTVERVAEAARMWVDYIKLSERLARVNSIELVIVRYDDLFDNPRAVLDRLLGYLDLAGADSILSAADDGHHVLGNILRMDFDGKLKPDVAWREQFAARELGQIHAVAAATMERLGFDTSLRDIGTLRS